MDTRPVLFMERNNSGRLVISVTEFDDEGYGVHSYVLSFQSEGISDSTMHTQFKRMTRLMEGNVRVNLGELSPSSKVKREFLKVNSKDS